jgi:hypothetical protein
MSSLQQNIYTHYTDNPIRWREILTMRRQKGKWFWRVLIGLSIFIMLIPILWGGSKYFQNAFSFTLVALVVANIVAYVLVVLRGVLTASEAVTRERRDKTWELLMLTGVSRWRLILGKWFGALRITTGSYLWLLFIRLGTVFWAVGQMNVNRISWEIGYENVRLWHYTFGNPAWVEIISLLLLFTLLEWAFNTALGIGLGFFRWKARTSTGAAVGVRVSLGLLPPILMYVILDYADGGFFNGFYDTYSERFITFIFRYVTTFADGGFFSPVFLADRYQVSQEYFSAFNLATAAGAITFAGLTVGALLLANNRAKAIGTNADEYVGSVKPKRKRKDAPKQAEAPDVESTSVRTSSGILPGTENIFALETPADYRAEVYAYQRRLGRLYLRLQQDDDIRYVRISGVSYLEAPAAWKGARFDALSEAEYESFRAEKGLSVNSLQAEHQRLYAHAGTPTVRIIGSSVELLDELPKNV